MLTAWVDEELQGLEERALRRNLRLTDNSLINFASNNYLGLSRHPAVCAAAGDAIKKWGVGSSSARLLSGHLSVHAELEQALAQWLNQKAALVFPAGYMANLGALTAFASAGDAIVMDRLCHASLIDAARLSGARLFVYRHNDAPDAERALKRAQTYRRRLLVTESLFSMDGDCAPLTELKKIAGANDALSIVDESHALGVMGAQGRGLSEGWDIILGTLSKALGSQGGFVAGSQTLMAFLVNKARPFIFTTALSPVCAAAALAALQYIRTTPDLGVRLLQRAQFLRRQLTAKGWDILKSQSQIVPMFVGEADAAVALAAQLRTRGFYAPAIRPPAVHAQECRLRLSVTIEHTEQQLADLVQALGEPHE